MPFPATRRHETVFPETPSFWESPGVLDRRSFAGTRRLKRGHSAAFDPVQVGGTKLVGITKPAHAGNGGGTVGRYDQASVRRCA